MGFNGWLELAARSSRLDQTVGARQAGGRQQAIEFFGQQAAACFTGKLLAAAGWRLLSRMAETLLSFCMRVPTLDVFIYVGGWCVVRGVCECVCGASHGCYPKSTLMDAISDKPVI